MRHAVVLGAALLVLAGCGTRAPEPRLPRPLASAWRREADAVVAALAAGDSCLARRQAVALQTSVIEAVNSRRLAPSFQEPLVGAVNELAARIRCPA